MSDHKDNLAHSLVVLETTGGYENACLDFLLDNNSAVHRADTRKVKNFIRSFGQHAKTDNLDAKALSFTVMKDMKDWHYIKEPIRTTKSLSF